MTTVNRLTPSNQRPVECDWGRVEKLCGTDLSERQAHSVMMDAMEEEEDTVAAAIYGRVAQNPVALAQQMRSLFRIKQLEQSVEKLERQVSELKVGISDKSIGIQIEGFTSDPSLMEVVRATEELFCSPITIETQCDPSDNDSVVVMLTVRALNLDFDEIIDRQLKWHERILSAKPGYSGQLRLHVVPSE